MAYSAIAQHKHFHRRETARCKQLLATIGMPRRNLFKQSQLPMPERRAGAAALERLQPGELLLCSKRLRQPEK